jgi:hypothetical protein
LHLLVVFGMLVMYGCFNVGGYLPVSAGIVAAVPAILPVFAAAAITAIAAAVTAIAAVAAVAAVAAAGFSVRRRRRIHLHRGCELLLDGHVAHRNRRRKARLHAQRVGLPHADRL